jgi:hypothetical protein
VEDLVDQDPAQLAGVVPQSLVEDDPALADEAGGVDFLAVPATGEQTPPERARRWRPFDADRHSQQWRQGAGAYGHIFSAEPQQAGQLISTFDL